jgi:hypothetical protein
MMIGRSIVDLMHRTAPPILCRFNMETGQLDVLINAHLDPIGVTWEERIISAAYKVPHLKGYGFYRGYYPKK